MILKCIALLLLMVQGVALSLMQLCVLFDFPFNNLPVYILSCVIVILIIGGWFKSEDNRIE